MQPNAAMYLPYRQEPPAGASLLVRSALPPASVMDAVRKVVQSVDADQPVFTIQTLDEMLADTRWPYRVFGGIFAIVAFVALALSAVGPVRGDGVLGDAAHSGDRAANGAWSGKP